VPGAASVTRPKMTLYTDMIMIYHDWRRQRCRRAFQMGTTDFQMRLSYFRHAPSRVAWLIPSRERATSLITCAKPLDAVDDAISGFSLMIAPTTSTRLLNTEFQPSFSKAHYSQSAEDCRSMISTPLSRDASPAISFYFFNMLIQGMRLLHASRRHA